MGTPQMSDLHPSPHVHHAQLDDPYVTRVVHRRAAPPALRLLTGAAGISTSVGVVVPMGGSAGQPFVDGLRGWDARGLRLEVLVVEHPDDTARPVLRDRLSRSGRSWRVVERPLGGRVAALAAAAEAAEQEFLLIPSSGEVPYEAVPEALSMMWTEGCDAAMLERQPTQVHELAAIGDPCAQLAAWLGLHGPAVPGRLVVLRRWVARWLLNELTRAIDPGEELADRARLLGIGIVRLDARAEPRVLDS
ncbi:MAG TPA: hypothetical protein VKZ55_08850 [Microthrixaceae bacterium]|nr:hypothetical protein [Microthrixaceae bacterium]